MGRPEGLRYEERYVASLNACATTERCAAGHEGLRYD